MHPSPSFGHLFCASLVAVSAMACGPDPRAEARLFLSRADGLSEGPFEERERQINALRAMGFRTAEVREARDACAGAAAALLEAEREGAAARTRADAVERELRAAGATKAPQIDPEFLAHLERSNQAIDRTRTLHATCEAKRTALERRYTGS